MTLVDERVHKLHAEVLATEPWLCAERALLVTEWFRDRAEQSAPIIVQKAEALAHVLGRKRLCIHDGELLVGSYTAHRVGGGLFPELHGVAVLEDLLRIARRDVNPLNVTDEDRRRLLGEVLPYWATRFLAARAFPIHRLPLFLADQLDPTLYLINETGGISHFVPDYASLLARGTDGYRAEAEERLAQLGPKDARAPFFRALIVVAEGLAGFAERYGREAERLASGEVDPARRTELKSIAATCARVPRRPATTFHEALQSVLFAQIALNLESLDNSVCPGRLDQVLWPYYQRDVDAGVLDRDLAFELLGCFAVKLCETVPAFSRRITRFHGGMFSGQVVVVGGVDREGRDGTNELSSLFVELSDRLRTRQPNYHARLHAGSPARFRERVARALAAGAASPAVYNDEVIVPMLRARGVSEADARDYANVGCVEPVAAGKSFMSTDAALFDLPLCLELALNRGRRFGQRRRVGAATPDAANAASVEAVFELFAEQVRHGLARLLSDLAKIERANARFHPTPLTSLLLDGCFERARDASDGGARYNGSGIQGVGAVEVGDSLAALEQVVFRAQRATLAEVIDACRADFCGRDALRARLSHAPKYGNDDARADRWVARVMKMFAEALGARANTRGGSYEAGFYSVTAHVAFGAKVGALPSGRRAGLPFSSGISPSSGMDAAGPTAALCSQAALPLARARNGVNYNLSLAPWAVSGTDGVARIDHLVEGAFRAGCMQIQINVLDPAILIEARDNPGRHRGLLVRVSGYSAYFDDLSPEMKQEIIGRTLHQAR